MDEFKLLTREEIVRRLVRMKGEKNIPRLTEITCRDVAKWLGVSRGCVRGHMSGAFAINDAQQITYSAFFSLLDAGCLKVETRGQGHQKTIVRVKPPVEPPKREIRPFIDFPTMRLKVE